MTQAVTFETIVKVAPGQVASNLDGEIIILNVNSGYYYGLDEVGTHVWQLLQQPRTVKAIYQSLLQTYAVDPAVCREDLLALLQTLHSRQLILTQTGKAEGDA